MTSHPVDLHPAESKEPKTTILNPSQHPPDSTIQDDVGAQQCTAMHPSSPRPMKIYTRDQLLFLSNSPLVKAPSDMPDLKGWFGPENEALVKKDEPPTPGTVRERRFRRDAEDGDAPSRPTFRSTLSQPSQMGNFKHQPLRADRDRERDRDRDGEKDRERDIRDKEGQERLRHLSDKYDRDRLALPPANARTKERDAASQLGVSSTRGQLSASSNAASRRAETREAAKKKVGEASEDWRRGAEPPRPSRDDGPENGRKDRNDRERARSRARDSSRPKREISPSKRDRDKDREDIREKAPRGDRDRDDHRREKDETRRDRDVDVEDDPRRWRDDGKREERLATRRSERDRARDKPTHDAAWDGTTDRRWTAAEDRDGRYKRATGRERKSGSAADEGKDKEDRKDKEKEPAWMDTYIPNESSPGILGGQAPGGELDGIQAWKKSLKDKESRANDSNSPTTFKERGTTVEHPSAPSNPETNEKPLDEIQLFKMMMKREEEKKRSEDGSSFVSNETSTPASVKGDPNTKPKSSQHRHRMPTEEASGAEVLSSSAYTIIETSHASQGPMAAQSTSADTAEAFSLSLKDISQIPVNASTSVDPMRDRNPTPSSRVVSNPTIPDTSQFTSPKQSGDFPAAQAFHPPPGSRLLAFARVQPKAVTTGNQANGPQAPNGGAQNMTDPQGYPKNESSRPTAGFSPFEEQARQPYGTDDYRDSGVLGNTINPLHRLPADQFFNPNNNPAEGNHNGLAAGKGSRFAKFFDGKTRDGLAPLNKQQGPVGFVSQSPNHHHGQRQDQEAMNGLMGNPGEQRTMDDIFAMLNNSSQRGNVGHHQTAGPLLANHGVFGAQGPTLHTLQQQHHLQQHPQHVNTRLEPLYESRADDRFVPDGMVPGLRTIPPPPPRGRDNLGHYSEQMDDSLHYNLQRMAAQQQARNLDTLYSGSAAPVYPQQGGRHVGVPLQTLQQPHYRGGPSPNLNQASSMANGQPQRLPPGLANLGGRPPHEPTPFLGLTSLPSGGPHNALHANGPLPQQQPPFNNFNVGNNLGFNGAQGRGPLPVSHMQGTVAQHPLSNIGHPNMDPRLSSHHHLMGLGGSGVVGTRMNGGYPQQGPSVPSHLVMRTQQQHQQQQQPHLHPHMLPHLIPPHLQQQGHSGPNNQPNDLMQLLLGGPHRE